MRKALNKYLARHGLEIIKTRGLYRRQRFFDAALAHKLNLVREVAEPLDYVVQRGPFAGLRLPAEGAWSDHDVAAKLLGAYEQQLHPRIEALLTLPLAAVVNIGASEGYYVLGMARRNANPRYFAYDIDEKATAVLQEFSQLNGVEVTSLTRFDSEDPLCDLGLKQDDAQVLFIYDCEGCEAGIESFPQDVLRRSLFLVELHDMFCPGVTQQLLDVLSPSHDIELINETGRVFDDFPELAELRMLEQGLILDEWRAEKMSWLYAEPKA
ncbi:hypothetical protein QO034_17825 [Sedimentitalea sp. JM2-8]|uniref:Methyltransferase, FkbM family n=1 Tax=Sedimentitalea xiamensis TaxID=3050037 RepID=A0ABT7FIM8_9RHOB|nr:hypothetical protein [Sedimentitalea xiamensis]MDK3074952.1 hypothetical protein [Sedimentitalea xiamensis]